MHSTLSHIGEFGREFWRRLNLADRLAFAAVLIYALLALFGPAQARIPGIAILRLVVIVAAGYLVIRGMLWTRAQWLWSMRNQLIDLYVFLAVVPLVLLLAMGALSLYLLYWHFGAYLVYADLEKRIDQVGVHRRYDRHGLCSGDRRERCRSAGRDRSRNPLPIGRRFSLRPRKAFPGLKIELGTGQELLARGS